MTTDRLAPFIYDEHKEIQKEIAAKQYEEQVRRLSLIPDADKHAFYKQEKEAREAELDEWRKKVRSFRWYRQHLIIQDKDSHNLIPLGLNEVQTDINAKWLEQERDNKPVRIICLKSRRMGLSTFIQGRMAHRAFTRRNFSGLTVAHDLDTSGYLFGMMERMYLRLPDDLKPKGLSKERNKRIDLDNGSSLRVETAVDPEAGRGIASLGLHCSEVGFWPYGEKTLLSLRQIIPDVPGTFIILESTANGSGNYFHQEWLRAVEGSSGYIPLFYGWHEFSKNQREVPEILLDGTSNLQLVDDYEEELRADGRSDEQIYWRRHTLKHAAGGNLFLFQQEYPYTADEAFIVSGRPYFKQHVKHFRPTEPKRVGDLYGSCERGTPIDFVDDPEGYLRIYQVPRTGTRYVIFADPSGILKEGEYSAFTDRTDAHDYCAAQVVNCRTFEQVAQYRSRIDTDQFAYELFKLGRLYNNAVLAIEMSGGYGLSPASILAKKLRYANLYYRQEVDTVTGNMGRSIGWMTTTVTRPLMLDSLNEILRDNPDKLKDKDLKQEMLHFIISRNGKPVASPGHHDDLVMSAAGVFMLAQQYAQSSEDTPQQTPALSIANMKDY